MAWLALNGTYELSETWSLQGNVYGRAFRQTHVDGNTGEFERCSNSASPRFQNRLCLEDDGFPRPSPLTTAFRDQFAILDQNDNPIPCPPGAGNTCAPVPYGTLDRTETQATTFGVSLQATNTDELFGHRNHVTLGASVDVSTVEFTARSRLGFIHRDLSISTKNPATIPGLGSIIRTFGDVGVGSVELTATNAYYGAYAVDTFDVTDRLSATLGVRLNVARLVLRDELGNSPDLDTDTTYHRFNPVAGVTYKILEGMSAYAGYAESNRVPTPLENSCSNPVKPCLIESFLVSDPPLKQVVGKTYEAGIRGNGPALGGTIDWKLGLFRIDSTDDIVQVASAIQGRGSFQNVPETRRQGIETGVEYRSSLWLAYASFAFVDATYRFTGSLPSPNNPFADADGNVQVTPGKKIPGTVRHQVKLGADYNLTPSWKIGGDLVVVDGGYLLGDDANQNARLEGYWLVGFHTTYQLTKNVQLFAFATNVLDKRYALSGTFFETQGVANALPIRLSNPRTEVPGQPASGYAGIRVRF
jgi:iron complex outermembrane receptor protein